MLKRSKSGEASSPSHCRLHLEEGIREEVEAVKTDDVILPGLSRPPEFYTPNRDSCSERSSPGSNLIRLFCLAGGADYLGMPQVVQ